VIAIGASTGGTVAIQEILLQLSDDMPPMVITQHIPAGFSLAFANRLNKLCNMEVREALDGDTLHRGLALVAPGDVHLLVRRAGTGYAIQLQRGPQVCYQRPSVDVMFASVAQAAGSHGIGVLLTGMGTDGAKGLLALRHAGATTIAQDEASCVVYGMPREATRIGAVCTVAPLAGIADVLTRTSTQINTAAAERIYDTSHLQIRRQMSLPAAASNPTQQTSALDKPN
jgi:two-component system chemotaxis response regulator CheB